MDISAVPVFGCKPIIEQILLKKKGKKNTILYQQNF